MELRPGGTETLLYDTTQKMTSSVQSSISNTLSEYWTICSYSLKNRLKETLTFYLQREILIGQAPHECFEKN